MPLNKGEINALEFLKGDGTDETTAFQTMVSTGKDICFPRPPVAYGVNGAITAGNLEPAVSRFWKRVVN